MYDWVTTAPQYYEKYSYDNQYKENANKSFNTLPPKPSQLTRSGTKVSYNALHNKSNIDPTLKSISKLIGQDEMYPKKKPTPSRRNSIRYQTQPIQSSKAKNLNQR